MTFDGSDKNYNKEIADRICARIAAGEYVRHACKAEGKEASTVYGWLDYVPEFSIDWEKSLKVKADLLLEKAALALSAKDDDDIVMSKEDTKMCHNARVNRNRAQAEFYKWWATKCDKSLSDRDVELEALKKQVAELEKKSRV